MLFPSIASNEALNAPDISGKGDIKLREVKVTTTAIHWGYFRTIH
jgi:hypothetical protein